MTYATYCPEDNKLRIYVGRVPRDEYEKLRAEGWTSTPKQDCDFVATWTPERRDTCLEYADVIEDEDQSPEDRAADRAERFAGYRDKRESEAYSHADRYEAGPTAHGFQSEKRAERAAARHDRIGTRATDAWSKAEYWQHRTAGVISHALYVSSPAVRMGRIKTIEAELRAKVATYEKAAELFDVAVSLRDIADPEEQTRRVLQFFGCVTSYREYPHPDQPEEKNTLYGHMTSERRRQITGKEALDLYLSDRARPDVENNDWANHFKLRLAYEWQMLEAQGGRAAVVEMEVGGWLGGRQIHKVNKSNATGRVVSVHVKGPRFEGWCYKAKNVPGTDYALYQIDTERLDVSAYRPPTDEERAAFVTEKKEAKKAAPKKEACPLVNPTDEDAEKLQTLWNSKAKGEPQTVLRLSQAQYSANSGGTYSSLETITLTERGTEGNSSAMGNRDFRHLVCKVRTGPSKGEGWRSARRVVVITDKPQKPLPFAKMETLRAQCPTVESMAPRLPEIQTELGKSWLSDMDRALLDDAVYIGWVSIQSMSQVYFTDAGHAAMKAHKAANAEAVAVA